MRLLSDNLKNFRTQMHPICTLGLFKTKKDSESFSKPLILLAGATRLELATSGLTGRRSNQLNYAPDFCFF